MGLGNSTKLRHRGFQNHHVNQDILGDYYCSECGISLPKEMVREYDESLDSKYWGL